MNDDKKIFAGLCRDFIDAATSSLHNGFERTDELANPDQAGENLRFIFRAAIPFFMRDTVCEAIGLLSTGRIRSGAVNRQDDCALRFADQIASHLLRDHSSYAVHRMVPADLRGEDNVRTAEKLGLHHLKTVLYRS